jgi:hypothetical protein
MKTKGTLREGFTDIVGPTLFTAPGAPFPNMIGGADVAGTPIADVIGTTDRTLPTGPNPFMNVLINELNDNTKRGPAKSITNSGEVYMGSPAFEASKYRKSFVHFRNLDALAQRVNKIEKQQNENNKS